MKTVKQERIETKLTLLEMRGFNWIVQDIGEFTYNTDVKIYDIIFNLKQQYNKELEQFNKPSKFFQSKLKL